MAGVSVTIESLNNVKRAFYDFQTDIENVSSKISSSTEQILVEVNQSVKKQESVVHTLENRVATLINENEQIQSAIITVNATITSLEAEIANLEKQKPQLEAQISRLEQHRRQLESRRSNSDGDNSGIEAQIRAIDNQIQRCRNTLHQIINQISSAKKQLADCEKQHAELKERKRQKENELSSAKNELKKAKSKLERLAAAGDSVFREVNNLQLSVRKFEQITSTSSETSKAGLNKCIAAIDEYLGTSLSPSDSHSSVASSSSHQLGNIRQILDSNPPAMRERILFEISVLRSSLELTAGNPALPQLGGSHREVRQQLQDLGIKGFQAHHIPSAAAQGAFSNQDREYWESLPTIAISNTDHLATDSYGGRQSRAYQSFLPDVPRSSSYRDEITAEIENGNFIEVVRNELYNIRDHFGHDYDGGISRYLDALESFLQNN